MYKFTLCLLLFVFGLTALGASTPPEIEELHASMPVDLGEEPPTVLVALLVRNKAHVLPLFLTYLERLSYPKQRLALWIRSDHNVDSSGELLQLWLNNVGSLYHSVDFSLDNDTQRYQNESSPYDWPAARYNHLIHLKETAFKYAHKIWADFIFFLDADVLLTYADTLEHLTSLRLPIVAPMLLSEGRYSNFWCDMTPDYYYKRTDEYMEIYNVDKNGIFQVPMVNSAVLVHMNYMGSRYLTFDREQLIEQQKHLLEWASRQGKQCRPYDGPLDDIIVFAVSANCSQIPQFVSNKYPYGYILQPLDTSDKLEQDLQQLINIRANIVHDHDAVEPVKEYFSEFVSFPEKTNLTLDHIYMINLDRRPERRTKMENLFTELGLDVEHFSAIDGKCVTLFCSANPTVSPSEILTRYRNLNLDVIQSMDIKFLAAYEDPYHHRQMTMGEVGCFLSHYRIWEKIVERGQKEVLVLEDDIRFSSYFKESAVRVLEQARSVVDFDLLYFGRKRLEENEPWVKGANNLVHPGYSYWTLGYVITLQGAKKLLDVKPLQKLVPVDEFLPIMFNRHPNKTWSSAFPTRNLIAFSAAPMILYPSHYTGEIGYISDTEDSEITTESGTYSTGAHPKSDRELDFAAEKFSREQEVSQFNLHDSGDVLILDLQVGESHDEF